MGKVINETNESIKNMYMLVSLFAGSNGIIWIVIADGKIVET